MLQERLGAGWMPGLWHTSPLLVALQFTLLAWLLTPVAHCLVGLLLEGRIVPLWKGQWRSFFPGDIFLGVAVGCLAAANCRAGAVSTLQRPVVHGAIAACTVLVAVVMTASEAKMLPITALLSPIKLYHNFVLYGGYGYVAVVLLIGVLHGGLVHYIALAVVMASCWVYLVVRDGKKSRHEVIHLQRTAHPTSYKLLGIVPIRGRDYSDE